MKFLRSRTLVLRLMNYLGRARRPDGSPDVRSDLRDQCLARHQRPEFAQLVSHEVVPGHVTTSALIQGLYVRGRIGFEGTVLTMNSRAAALAEGSRTTESHRDGSTEVEELPGEDLQLGVNWRSSRTTRRTSRLPDLETACPEGRRRDAPPTSSSCPTTRDASCPALGRTPARPDVLPAYRAGTEAVAELRRRHRRRRSFLRSTAAPAWSTSSRCARRSARPEEAHNEGVRSPPQAFGEWLVSRITRPRLEYRRYVFNDPEKLKSRIRPGDVVLVDGDQRVSQVVKYLTMSPWSHSAIFVGSRFHAGPAERAETRGASVKSRAIDRGGARRPGRRRVPADQVHRLNIRICRPVGLTAAQIKTVLDEVAARMGFRYDRRTIRISSGISCHCA